MYVTKSGVRAYSGPILLGVLLLTIPIAYWVSRKELVETSQLVYSLISVWVTFTFYWKGVALSSQSAEPDSVTKMEGWTAGKGLSPAESESRGGT